ncbi:hypothetical protein CsSME_00000984 [Camellia sinensis var. sinensis]
MPCESNRMIAKAKRVEAEFLAACEVDSAFVETATGAQGHEPHWVPPSRGKWKFNCNAAIDLSRGRGAVAILLRDKKGYLVDGIAAKIQLATAISICSVTCLCHGPCS